MPHMMPLESLPKEAEALNKKTVIHEKCGKKHIDLGEFATFNHRKHLCMYCNEFFYDDVRGVGV